MITFGIRVKENKVKGDLGKFRTYLGKLTGDLLTQEACLTARAALKYAPPLVRTGGKGDTAEAGRMGIRAIDKDVKAIFATPGCTLGSIFIDGDHARSFKRFLDWRQRPLAASSSTLMSKLHGDDDVRRAYQRASNLYANKPNRSKYVTSVAEMVSLHNQERKNGRVVREGRPSAQVKRYPHIVANPVILKKYIALRALQVGKLKSGWWQIIYTYGKNLNIFGRIVDAGAKGLPKYITRHSGNGALVKAFGGLSKKVSIKNELGDADGAGMRAKTFSLVLRHRQAAIAKRPYQQYANRIVRNWNNGQGPYA
jgi:hypothetical protein